MAFSARIERIFLVGTVLGLTACGGSSDPSSEAANKEAPPMSEARTAPFADLDATAPVAEKRPVTIEQHGIERVDPYAWMRDEGWQEVLRDPSKLDADIRAHLDDENTFYKAATDDLAGLREQLFEEMRGRIKEDDSTVPAIDGEFAYSVRYREDGNYPIFVRTPKQSGAETILYDGDQEAGDSEFFRIGSVDHSRDHKLIAYGVDRLGSEYYDIRIRDIASGEEYEETLTSTDGDAVWAADSKSFYYVERDDNQRPKRVKHHMLGTPQSEDLVVYEEPDDTFFLFTDVTQSGEYLLIGSAKGTSSEYRFLSMDAPAGTEPTLIAPRRDDELYYVEQHGDSFLIQTNADDAIDFKVVKAPIDNPGREQWEDWLTHRPGTYLLSLVPYRDHIVRLERRNALPRIVVSDVDRENEYDIDFEEAAYNVDIDSGYEFDTTNLRFTYESPSTPEQVFDFDLSTRERTLRKTQEIPSGHDSDRYQVERLFIEAGDGAKVPVTVLRLKSTPVDGTAPLMLYGYGSYGATMQAWFSTSVLSLVDRGVIYATAHVRGGAAMGRQWYLDGKLDKKKNSFSDFADAAEQLQKLGYGRKGETVIYGGSAGGLLVGGTLNLRPELFGGAIAAVPFVDVINTISDAELPLTPPEWVEWGDPINSAEAYADMAAYSPYDNIRADVDYPPVLATGGVSDYRVTYWEPAKWVARMRDEASGGPFFLKMNMGAGHSGSAARFERLKERAHDYAFALKVFGLDQSAVDVAP
ncbi:MAG: S9 family peptidase [Pseudomonadota bacterium]